MGEKDEGLGLSLSLGWGGNQNSLKVNPINNPALSLPSQRTSWNDVFQLPADPSSETRSFLRGLDVNLAPSMAVDCDDENGVSSPNSTISSISGKRSEREANGDENDTERTYDEDGEGDGIGGDTSRKKLRLSKEQALVLEETFKEHNTLNPKQKQALARQLNLRPRQVEVWFQNRRARTKLKQTEVDCEYLKKCCENLTEENRRLQKEVQELRALKLSPHLYMHMNPPTTLTMCPSCERVTASSSSSSSSSATAAAASAAAPTNRNPVGLNVQRPIPINPWAAMLARHRRP